MAKENKSNIIIYQSEDGQTHIEVQMDEDTVWLSQQQMADLYQTSRTNVVEHIKHIYEDGELVEDKAKDEDADPNKPFKQKIHFLIFDVLCFEDFNLCRNFWDTRIFC